jgi:DnaJ-class molecular chaperone
MENLRALVYGHKLSMYQKTLAIKEFEMLESKVKALENKPEVVRCPDCDGSGTSDEGVIVSCYKCDGYGVIENKKNELLIKKSDEKDTKTKSQRNRKGT